MYLCNLASVEVSNSVAVTNERLCYGTGKGVSAVNGLPPIAFHSYWLWWRLDFSNELAMSLKCSLQFQYQWHTCVQNCLVVRDNRFLYFYSVLLILPAATFVLCGSMCMCMSKWKASLAAMADFWACINDGSQSVRSGTHTMQWCHYHMTREREGEEGAQIPEIGWPTVYVWCLSWNPYNSRVSYMAGLLMTK